AGNKFQGTRKSPFFCAQAREILNRDDWTQIKGVKRRTPKIKHGWTGFFILCILSIDTKSKTHHENP
ncbi:MAG: hypothetical protein ACJ06V_11740, partial [Verrucomicrobiota bacterium]